jgi:hypothetical protein
MGSARHGRVFARILADLLRHPGEDPDPLRRAGSELVLMPLSAVLGLIPLEFARMGPRDLELISVVRALDAETRLGIQRPPLLAWLPLTAAGLP